MKKQNFLSKLKDDGKIEMVEPSEEIKLSYLAKGDNCLKAAKLLLPHSLYENSIVNSYYAMYNYLIALFFKAGIKCENHSGAIILFKLLFKNNIDLIRIISKAKEERIDKQYYLESKENIELTNYSAQEMIDKAEDFIIKIKLFIDNLSNNDIIDIRNKFTALFMNKQESLKGPLTKENSKTEEEKADKKDV